MFKITPVQDPSVAREYAALCNIEIREGAFIYAMTDVETGNLMGMSQFEIMGEYGYIYNLSEAPGLNDFEAMFILGRQTMNFIDLCGAHLCRADKHASRAELLKAIGFKESADTYLACDMSGMFDGSHCSGGH